MGYSFRLPCRGCVMGEGASSQGAMFARKFAGCARGGIVLGDMSESLSSLSEGYCQHVCCRKTCSRSMQHPDRMLPHPKRMIATPLLYST